MPNGNHPQGGKLFVFLHGLIVLVERPNELVAAVVDMGDKHVYRFGHWLREQPLPRGTEARLEGVAYGNSGLSTDESFYDNVRLRPLSPLIYAAIRLPKPGVPVHAFRKSTIPSQHHSTTAPLRGQPNVVAGLRVIEYSFDDLAGVRLQPLPWEPQLFSDEKRTATLHLIAEPETQVDQTHHIDEFVMGAQLFEDVAVTLTAVPMMSRLEDSYPEELPRPEALSLRERGALMREVAAFYRLNADLPPGSSWAGAGGELCGTRGGATGN